MLARLSVLRQANLSTFPTVRVGSHLWVGQVLASLVLGLVEAVGGGLQSGLAATAKGLLDSKAFGAMAFAVAACASS